jgi:hypothetical protein
MIETRANERDYVGEGRMTDGGDRDQHLQDSLRLARELIALADEGEAASEDDGCRILYGVMRDCGYRLRREVEREQKAHRNNGC